MIPFSSSLLFLFLPLLVLESLVLVLWRRRCVHECGCRSAEESPGPDPEASRALLVRLGGDFDCEKGGNDRLGLGATEVDRD